MITRTDILAHLEYQVRTGFLQGMRAYTPIRSAFTSEPPSTGAFETYADMGALPWPRQVTGQPAGTATDERTGAQVAGGLSEGGPVQMIGANEVAMVLYNDGFEITVGIYHDAINDNRVGNLENWARSAGARFEQFKDYQCFDALNSGGASTYGLCYDGQFFFDTDHADKGAEYTTNQSNALSTALSYANFKAARIAAGKFKDQRGQPIGLTHDQLIVSLDLEEDGYQLTSNPERYDTADRARNPFTGTRLIVAPGGWLDTTAWYLAVGNMPQKPLILQTRQAPILYFWDDHTQGGGVRYYKWYERHRVGYGDWRLIIQGNT